MEALMEILAELRPDIEFEGNEALIDNGELDSFDIVTLVGELSEAFEVEIGADEIVPENFNSVEAMMAMITRLQED